MTAPTTQPHLVPVLPLVTLVAALADRSGELGVEENLPDLPGLQQWVETGPAPLWPAGDGGTSQEDPAVPGTTPTSLAGTQNLPGEISRERREARETGLTFMAGLRSRLTVSPAWISLLAVTARQSSPVTFHTEISALGEQEWPANLRVGVRNVGPELCQPVRSHLMTEPLLVASTTNSSVRGKT